MEQRVGLDNQQERRETAIRLAAFYEGEGTFIVSHYLTKQGWHHCTPVIRLGNCDPAAVEEVSRILTLHNVGHRIYLQKKYSPNHAQVAVIGVEGCKRVVTFLEEFGDYFFGRKRANVKLFRKYLPLLMGKKAVKNSPKEARDARTALVQEFTQANKELNRLGVSRFLIDYTPDAIQRRYSQAPLEN
jgi:hypothetical protein